MKRTSASRVGFFLSVIASATLLFVAACKKDHNEPPPTTAKGSLYNAAGECIPNIVHGRWLPGDTTYFDSNYVELHVAVTRKGTYSISTDKLNGVIFSASGNFTDTGLNIVKLRPAGSFTNSGTFTFPVSFDSTNCQFSIDVEDTSVADLPLSGFRVTIAGHTYQGAGELDFYGVPGTGGGQLYAIYQARVGSPASDTAFELDFGSKPGPYWIGATYDTAAYPCGMLMYLASTNKILYGSASTNGLTMQFNAASPQIGTFNGPVKDSAGNVFQITNGKLKSFK